MGRMMFNCQEATRLVSESLDRKLPFHQRVGIRVHLLMCKFCSRYEKQLMFLRKTLRTQKMVEEDTASYVSLPPEARTRMTNFLHDHLDKPG
ncbi:MAG: zf-HC2 domain-containing protein [Desulfobacterales bacterium]|nr:MAG: zf-HC2 domain-containing protein [Desulfobacterales bacterium]UCD90201.1 MAG: zf-HC2 domain-containing protein [Desulfobacterales bacterium]